MFKQLPSGINKVFLTLETSNWELSLICTSLANTVITALNNYSENAFILEMSYIYFKFFIYTLYSMIIQK